MPRATRKATTTTGITTAMAVVPAVLSPLEPFDEDSPTGRFAPRDDDAVAAEEEAAAVLPATREATVGLTTMISVLGGAAELAAVTMRTEVKTCVLAGSPVAAPVMVATEVTGVEEAATTTVVGS